MPALWMVLVAISMFMLFFTITEMTGVAAGFLTAGWFVVILLCIFEALSITRTNTRKPSSDEEREQYYARMRRLSARKR